jgi:hypothetical protein
MHTKFQFHGISGETFEPLFSLSDAQLAARGMVRVVADESPGYPCRVSLREAALGEELLLLNFAHQTAHSPYQSTGPIFIRRGAERATLAPGEIPESVTRRLISLRAYNAAHMIVDAEVCEGTDIATALQKHFGASNVAYIHLHNAKRGCYSCSVVRA